MDEALSTKTRPAEFAGWKADRSGLFAGFETEDGELHVLVLSVEQAERTLPAFLAELRKARALANDLPTDSVACEFMLRVASASFGTVPTTGEVFASVNLASGGGLAFVMGKDLARGFANGLLSAADQPPVSLKPVLN